MSSKDFDETCTMHTISDNIEFMTGNKTSGIIKRLLLSRGIRRINERK